MSSSSRRRCVRVVVALMAWTACGSAQPAFGAPKEDVPFHAAASAALRTAPSVQAQRVAGGVGEAVPGAMALLLGAMVLLTVAQGLRTHRLHVAGRRERIDARWTTVRALAAAVGARDGCTGRHIERVSELGLLLARELDLPDAGSEQMAYGFLLHDVGKLAVPDAILQKAGPLDPGELAVMREHPASGAHMLEDLPFLDRALDVVRHHHERWDGSGYPARLAGEQIPLWARVFAVADAVDAMTSDRPYRAGCSLGEARAELRACAGSQFDPACVEAFLRLDRDRVATLLEDPAEVAASNCSTSCPPRSGRAPARAAIPRQAS